MGVRVFQIIVPIIVLLFIFYQVRRLYLARVEVRDIIPSVFIALLIGLVALFPDSITNKIARFFQFESNINALLFMLIGILVVGVILLYDMYRKQQREITRLTIEVGILKGQKEGTLP